MQNVQVLEYGQLAPKKRRTSTSSSVDDSMSDEYNAESDAEEQVDGV